VALFSKEGHADLVIRPHAPMRRLILTVTVADLVISGLYADCELGRYYAG